MKTRLDTRDKKPTIYNVTFLTAVVALVFIFVVVKYGLHRFEYTPANAGPYTLHKIKQTIIMGVMIIVYIVFSIIVYSD